MTLTADRNTLAKEGNFINAPVAAAKKIYEGALVALDASGNATPGLVATTLKSAGRAEENIDNSTGAAGDKRVLIRKGVFKFGNYAADLITRADIGNPCYIVDDEQVARTNGTSTRSVAGTIFDVDTDGVWVRFV